MNRRHARRQGMIALALTGAMIALAGCAPEPDVQPTPTPTDSAVVPYDGPVVFVGDELESFLLTPAEVAEAIPEATGVMNASAVLEQVSDGGGTAAVPAICDALFAEQSLGSVGARVTRWMTPSDPEYGQGRVEVLQFADEQQARDRMDQLLQAAADCGQFTKEAPVTFDAEILDEVDGVRAFAGTLLDIDGGYDWRVFQAYAAVGNVVVMLNQPFTGDRTYDAQAAASLLQQRAGDARDALVADLTENPPVPEEQPVTDAAQPWSEWAIGVDGVGPVLLGDAVDVAVAAAGGTATPPTFDRGPWIVENPEATASMLIQQAEDAETVWYVTVGTRRGESAETPQDGAALPALGDVRVGMPVSEAFAALPGGTIVDVASSGEDYYAVTTREGRLFRFDTEGDAADGTAIIIGITVEDATQRASLRFG
ncbi:hypothetical protein [Microbacterium sp. NPDC089695]|uniref:hypothetical protein n=1 Tax=Microbacterium sp. NPDC089695 TaxID=3364198 RepID=UPI00380473C5